MDKNISKHLLNLKSALVSLRPTGADGFEGIIAVALAEITGVPFRFASSGSQFGLDGQSSFHPYISFEAKRYDKKEIPKNEVLSKIMEISIHNPETELWILGATTAVGTQLSKDLNMFGIDYGISIFILDWSEINLPLLSVTLCMGGKEVESFLQKNITEPNLFDRAIKALNIIKSSKQYESYKVELEKQFKEASLGLALSKNANVKWFEKVFSNRTEARSKLGQPISPADQKLHKILIRENLTSQIQSFLNSNDLEHLLIVHGNEGNGKSWIIAQSWLVLNNKPLLIFFTTEDFSRSFDFNNIEELLIKKLIMQTGDYFDEKSLKRWRRRIKLWLETGNIENHLLVVIDGINQKPELPWSRFIELIYEYINRLNGKLIITSRSFYYINYVKSNLSYEIKNKLKEIRVPEWSVSERNEILCTSQFNVNNLQNKVAVVLCNPRILGIALELFDNSEISSLSELSIPRLLFEHIRNISQNNLNISVQRFVKKLQEHASTVLARVKKNQEDDLKVFEDKLNQVAEGRFFTQLENSPLLYRIEDDGLNLALAFSLIDELSHAKRNNKSVEERLIKVIEPISVLDDSAEVIFSALTILVNQYENSEEIPIALIKAFADFQNVNSNLFPAYVGLVKKRPEYFMKSAEIICLSGDFHYNYDWLEQALIEASNNNQAWSTMTTYIEDWLSSYSLSIDYHWISRQNQEAETLKLTKKLENKLDNLSKFEQDILDGLNQQDGSLGNLTQLAFYLLAGKNIESFVPSVVKWAFSHSLNSHKQSAYDDFIALIKFNKMDWAETRKSILDQCKIFKSDNISEIGKWTLAKLFESTGYSDDANDLKELWQSLVDDERKSRSWKRIETYCSSDPCNPDSLQPENVKETFKNYALIDVKELNHHRGQTSESIFFHSAMPCVSRFSPNIGITKIHEFFDNVLSRKGYSLRQGIYEIENFSFLIGRNFKDKFIHKWKRVNSGDDIDDLEEKDVSWLLQDMMQIFFPLLSADEQLEFIKELNKDNCGLSYELIDYVSQLNQQKLERLIETYLQNKEYSNLFNLLALAHTKSIILSDKMNGLLEQCFKSDHEYVRTFSLAHIAEKNNHELFNMVVNSNWSNQTVSKRNHKEYIFGSEVLIKAASKNLISYNETLNRVDSRFYGLAYKNWDSTGRFEIIRRLDFIIFKEFDLDENINTARLSNFDSVKEQQEFIKFTSDYITVIDWDSAFNLGQFSEIISDYPDIANHWYIAFINISESSLDYMHNKLALLAYAFAKTDIQKSEDLFRKIKDVKPTINRTIFGYEIGYDSLTLWKSKRTELHDQLRYERLDKQATDYNLSHEVFTALAIDHQDLLYEYILLKLSKFEPFEQARAIMVVGFSEPSAEYDLILKNHEQFSGIIGEAYKVAKYAYERNMWAKHWYKLMCSTGDRVDFWRYLVLFSKIVDSRFYLWQSKFDNESSLMKLYTPVVLKHAENRIKKWKDNRSKTLFGGKIPANVFID